MDDLRGARIVVAGGGVLGAACALGLIENGAAVVLADPAALGDNASGVAAGMLAPALESVLDTGLGPNFKILKQARDLWPAFIDRLGLPAGTIDRSGALWLGPPDAAGARLGRLHAVGAAAELMSAHEAERLCPGLQAAQGAVFTPDDWRIEALPLLAVMRRVFLDKGGIIVRASVVQTARGSALLSDGSILPADWIVLAGGHPSPQSARLAPELKHLLPIKGQIIRFLAGAGPSFGPVVRSEAVYVAPGPAGAMAGATMEPGASDRRCDPAVAKRLQSAAAHLFPELEDAPHQAFAGVRSATPDGRPLVGPSRAPGVLLATGARRNGWLLATLVAQMIVAHASGDCTGEPADAFWASRFGD